MNENITNCLFALPSYFSGLALLVGHREENTNYKKKLIKIASKSGPTMNISLSPLMDGSFFALLLLLDLPKTSIQFASTNGNPGRGMLWLCCCSLGSTTITFVRCRCLRSMCFKALHIEKMKRTLWRILGPVHLDVLLADDDGDEEEEEEALDLFPEEEHSPLHLLCCCSMRFTPGDSISKAAAS